MNTPAPYSSHYSLTLRDVYYVLFRHKRRILVCTAVGLLVAIAIFFLKPPPFTSEAKLYVRYVVTDRKTPSPSSDETQTKSPDKGGETIMESEEEILTSMDLARQVAAAVGPARILGSVTGTDDALRAAAVIKKGLTVSVPPRTSVITISFKHRNPGVVQPVLRELIDSYLKMHVEIHRAVGLVGDFLAEETDQLRARLNQTENELRKALNKAGALSGEEGKKAAVTEIAALRHELISAQAEVAERTAILEASGRSASEVVSPEDRRPDERAVLADLRRLEASVTRLEQREQELLAQFTPESPRIRDLQVQIDQTRGALQALRDRHPEMNSVRVSTRGGAAGPPALDPWTEHVRVAALNSRIKVLNDEMERLRTETVRADENQGTIAELRRRKELEESNYRYYAASLERSRINEALGAGKVSNISEIQSPSPPHAEWAKTNKLLLGAAVGGLALGIAWAFFIELYVDTSVRRPRDVERALGLHLFLAIPKIPIDAAERNHSTIPPARRLQGRSHGAAPESLPEAEAPEPPLTEGARALRAFHETLGDRLVSYFHGIGVTHTPKLIAVTGLGAKAGVTTIAAGLARTLAENGEENVLLVDMTAGQGSIREFYQRRPPCDLDELLQTRDSAQVQNRLYVVTDGPTNDATARPNQRRFSKLVPQLKTSDFDYIIFDMPPVSQVSITPRLAGFMDLVFLVIESEKTDRELVQRATILLAQSKVHVGAVLNKTRNYIPARLEQAFVGPA